MADLDRKGAVDDKESGEALKTVRTNGDGVQRRSRCLFCCCCFGLGARKQLVSDGRGKGDNDIVPTQDKAIIIRQMWNLLRCPVTLEIFRRPFLAQNGRTYEHNVVNKLYQSPIDPSRLMDPTFARENHELHRFFIGS